MAHHKEAQTARDYREHGNFELAIRHMTRAVQVDQRNFEFVVQLCELYLLELRRLETMVVVPPTGKLAEARIKAQLYFQTALKLDRTETLRRFVCNPSLNGTMSAEQESDLFRDIQANANHPSSFATPSVHATYARLLVNRNDVEGALVHLDTVFYVLSLNEDWLTVSLELCSLALDYVLDSDQVVRLFFYYCYSVHQLSVLRMSSVRTPIDAEVVIQQYTQSLANVKQVFAIETNGLWDESSLTQIHSVHMEFYSRMYVFYAHWQLLQHDWRASFSACRMALDFENEDQPFLQQHRRWAASQVMSSLLRHIPVDALTGAVDMPVSGASGELPSADVNEDDLFWLTHHLDLQQLAEKRKISSIGSKNLQRHWSIAYTTLGNPIDNLFESLITTAVDLSGIVHAVRFVILDHALLTALVSALFPVLTIEERFKALEWFLLILTIQQNAIVPKVVGAGKPIKSPSERALLLSVAGWHPLFVPTELQKSFWFTMLQLYGPEHVRGKKFHAVLSHVDLTEVLDEIVGSKASSSHQAPWTFGRLGAVLQKMGASEDSQQCATLAQRKMGLPSRAMFSKVTASIFDSTTDIIVPSSPVILDNSKNITFTLPSSPALPPPADMITPPPAVVERILPKSPASKPIVVSSSFNRPPQVTSKFSLSTSDDGNDEENDLSSGKGPAKPVVSRQQRHLDALKKLKEQKPTSSSTNRLHPANLSRFDRHRKLLADLKK